jgi:transposase-like protein
MADELSMALLELLRKAEMDQDVDFLREGVRTLSQALLEIEVSQHLGAERHERTKDAYWATQWLPGATVGHTRGHDPAAGAAR